MPRAVREVLIRADPAHTIPDRAAEMQAAHAAAASPDQERQLARGPAEDVPRNLLRAEENAQADVTEADVPDRAAGAKPRLRHLCASLSNPPSARPRWKLISINLFSSPVNPMLLKRRRQRL